MVDVMVMSGGMEGLLDVMMLTVDGMAAASADETIAMVDVTTAMDVVTTAMDDVTMALDDVTTATIGVKIVDVITTTGGLMTEVRKMFFVCANHIGTSILFA